MATLERPLQEVLEKEAPKAVEVTREVWQQFANQPDLRNIINKFDVGSSGAGAARVRVTPTDSEAAAKLQDVLSEVGHPEVWGHGADVPVNEKGFELRGKPYDAEPVGEDFDISGAQKLDPQTGKYAGGMDNLPAVSGNRLPEVAPPSGFAGPAPDDLSANLQGKGSFGKKLAAGAVAAGAVGAGYLASQKGSDKAGAGDAATDQGPADEAGASAPTPPPPPTAIDKNYNYKIARLAKDPDLYKGELDKIDNEIKKVGKTELTDADMRGWDRQMTELRRVYSEAVKRNEWSEVAEKMGHALTQFFAARQGLQTGADLSGLKFDKTDWMKKNQLLLDGLKEDVGMVDSSRKAEIDRVKSAKDALDRFMSLRAKYGTSKGELDNKTDIANQGASESEQKLGQGVDVAKIGATSRENVADTAASAKSGKMGENQGRSLDTAITLMSSVDTQTKTSAKDGIRKDALKAAGAAGIPADVWAAWQEEAEKNSHMWGKSADKIMAENMIKWRTEHPGRSTGTSVSSPGAVGARGPDYEKGIGAVMASNPGSSRADVVKALKAQNKLPADYK